MKTLTVGVLTLGLLLACVETAEAKPSALDRAKQRAVIHEDDPRWDCRTMGNRVCGVPGPGGVIHLVHHDSKGQPVRVSLR